MPLNYLKASYKLEDSLQRNFALTKDFVEKGNHQREGLRIEGNFSIKCAHES